MKKDILVFVVSICLWISGFTMQGSADEIIWEHISRENLNLKAVLVHPQDSRIIYLGSEKGVFKTEDRGETWKNILSIRADNQAANSLLFGSQDKNFLYAATGNGLFYSPNQGKSWMRIFKGKNSLENDCSTLAVLPYGIYLGTKAGLFISPDKGRTWYKEKGKIGKSQVLAITYNAKESYRIYVACVDGVFKTEDAGKSWERIFVAQSGEDGIEIEEITEDHDEEKRYSEIRYIACDENNPDYLYLATTKGVYQSKDKGLTWDLLTTFGLLSQDVKSLFVSGNSTLYAITKSGIFKYEQDRWPEVSLGLIAREINSLGSDNLGTLYAACNSGLFRAKINANHNEKSENTISAYSKNEPSIRQVQQEAIKYAEVEPEKIMRWRKQAKMKALLPKLTLGLDRSESTNYEIYTSQTTRYVYEGPHDRSSGFDVTLSWELGDLIWSDDQTNIDVRSRLMVQLRDDILDEVTKLYFERLRVEKELENLSLEERKKRFEKELKLEELTAMLDALTGGYFSQALP
jgi:photosystem II stability/assembly factor-like uncharacterized protein